MIVTAVALFALLQSISHQQLSPPEEQFPVMSLVAAVLGCIAIGVTVWAPVLGMFVGFVPLAMTPIFHAYGVDVLILVVTVLAVLPVAPRWAAGLLAAA